MKKNKKIIILFLLLIIIYSISIVPKTFQNDTFFTLAVGEKILNEGIYTEETFTWHEGLQYENVRWLFDITMTQIYRVAGFLGLYVFEMFMTSLIGITIFYILLKRKNHIVLSFFITIITLYLGRNAFAIRAQIVSFWLFILEAYWIEKLLETGKKQYTIKLILDAILLANIHASVFPMYFVLYMPYIAEWILSKIHFLQTEDSKIIIEKRKYIKLFLITLFFAMFAGLCTPIGWAPYTDMFKTVGAASSDFIAEMLPITLVDVPEFAYMIIVVVAILGFTKTKIRLVDGLYLLGFGLLSLSTNRSLFFFIFIGMLSVARIVTNFLEDYAIKDWKLKKKTKSILTIILTLFILMISIKNINAKINNDYVDTKMLPADATKFILSHVDMENMRLYNGFNYGSYLEFYGIPVFMDSRAEIYLKEFNHTTILEDAIKLSSGTMTYQTMFDKYEITHALLYNTELVNLYIANDPNWKIIYQDDIFSLYEHIK